MRVGDVTNARVGVGECVAERFEGICHGVGVDRRNRRGEEEEYCCLRSCGEGGWDGRCERSDGSGKGSVGEHRVGGLGEGKGPRSMLGKYPPYLQSGDAIGGCGYRVVRKDTGLNRGRYRFDASDLVRVITVQVNHVTSG